MKKLKIKNKRQFKKAIMILIMTLAIIATIILFGNYLKFNGLDSLFTVNAYKEAFRTTEDDIAIINLLMGLFVGTTLTTSFNLLLEYKSEDEEDEALNEILKRNGVM